MKRFSLLRALAVGLLNVAPPMVDFNNQTIFSSNHSKNKPNRISQKKRRLNQRRKGK